MLAVRERIEQARLSNPKIPVHYEKIRSRSSHCHCRRRLRRLVLTPARNRNDNDARRHYGFCQEIVYVVDIGDEKIERYRQLQFNSQEESRKFGGFTLSFPEK
jgi:hypothetical protein